MAAYLTPASTAQALMSATSEVSDAEAVKAARSMSAVSLDPPSATSLISAPDSLVTLSTILVSICLKGTTTALTEGVTSVFTPAMKSDAEMPAVWSAATLKEAGTPAD